MERNKGLHFSAEREREREGAQWWLALSRALTPPPLLGGRSHSRASIFTKLTLHFLPGSVVTVMVVLDPVSPLLSEEKFQQRQASLTCHGQATKPFQNLQATLSERLGLPLYLVQITKIQCYYLCTRLFCGSLFVFCYERTHQLFLFLLFCLISHILLIFSTQSKKGEGMFNKGCVKCKNEFFSVSKISSQLAKCKNRRLLNQQSREIRCTHLFPTDF